MTKQDQASQQTLADITENLVHEALGAYVKAFDDSLAKLDEFGATQIAKIEDLVARGEQMQADLSTYFS